MPLDEKKKQRLRAMGAKVTTVEKWLDLTPAEVAVIDMRIRLGEQIRSLRRQEGLSQERAAQILGTSQGRVSRLENGQASLDQLAKSLLALGGSTQEMARVIAG